MENDFFRVWGDYAFMASGAGMIIFTLLFLIFTKWHQSFVGRAVAFFFAAATVQVAFSLLRLITHSADPVLIVRAPVLTALAVSVWVLLGSFVVSQFRRKKKQNTSDISK